MAFIVVYDANAMYGSTPRDLLIRIARAGLVQAKWTEDILDEVFGSLARNRPDIAQEKLTRLRELLRAAFASPEGRATAADAARLAELAPVRSMIFTADDVPVKDVSH